MYMVSESSESVHVHNTRACTQTSVARRYQSPHGQQFPTVDSMTMKQSVPACRHDVVAASGYKNDADDAISPGFLDGELQLQLQSTRTLEFKVQSSPPESQLCTFNDANDMASPGFLDGELQLQSNPHESSFGTSTDANDTASPGFLDGESNPPASSFGSSYVEIPIIDTESTMDRTVQPKSVANSDKPSDDPVGSCPIGDCGTDFALVHAYKDRLVPFEYYDSTDSFLLFSVTMSSAQQKTIRLSPCNCIPTDMEMGSLHLAVVVSSRQWDPGTIGVGYDDEFTGSSSCVYPADSRATSNYAPIVTGTGVSDFRVRNVFTVIPFVLCWIMLFLAFERNIHDDPVEGESLLTDEQRSFMSTVCSTDIKPGIGSNRSVGQVIRLYGEQLFPKLVETQQPDRDDSELGLNQQPASIVSPYLESCRDMCHYFCQVVELECLFEGLVSLSRQLDQLETLLFASTLVPRSTRLWYDAISSLPMSYLVPLGSDTIPSHRYWIVS